MYFKIMNNRKTAQCITKNIRHLADNTKNEDGSNKQN